MVHAAEDSAFRKVALDVMVEPPMERPPMSMVVMCAVAVPVSTTQRSWQLAAPSLKKGSKIGLSQVRAPKVTTAPDGSVANALAKINQSRFSPNSD